MLRESLQAVIWDLDGTLVDTAELHFRAWCKLTEKYGLPFTRADFTGTFGWRNPEIIPHLFQITDADGVEKLGDEKEAFYRSEAERGVELLPGARERIEEFARAGLLQAIGSSAPRVNIELILQMTGVSSYFSAIASMEDTQRGKPNPEVFLLAAKKLGVEPERCLVVEDAPVGVQAAKAAGMRCLAVTFAGHHPKEKLQQAGADCVVESLAKFNLADTC